jgi:uncharacterized protein (TIGR03067 family)
LSRLSWARDRLRYRLSAGAVTAAVPPALLVGTANAALAVAAGKAIPAAIVSDQVATLTEGVLRTMWVTKLKAFASVVLVVAVLGTAGLFTLHALGAADSKEGKKSASDKDRFQGTWAMVSGDHGGEKVPEKDLKNCTLTVNGDKATLMMLGRTIEGTIALDPGKKPKQIDLKCDEGAGTMVNKGIYVLEGDTLKLCIAHPPHERPKEIATKKGEKWPALFVFKRQGKDKAK